MPIIKLKISSKTNHILLDSGARNSLVVKELVVSTKIIKTIQTNTVKKYMENMQEKISI